MGTSIRRTAVWLVLAALSIAGAAWMATGVSADAGAPDTGRLKIVKNLGGGWPDGAFIFTWTCTDGQSGSVTFPDEFNGASHTTTQNYPLGTVCTVEETDGVLSVSDYEVTTHIEGTAGFQAINPRDVPIDNSAGQNTIQYMNDPKQPDPHEFQIVKEQLGGPLDTVFTFSVQCDGTPFEVEVIGNSASDVILDSADSCTVTEVSADSPNGLDDWTTDPVSRQITLDLDPQGITTFEFTNTWIEPEPEDATVIVKKKFEGPEDWRFGFAFACQAFGNADTFVLGGGESSPVFTIPFHTGNVTLINGDENSHDGPYTVCAAVEEALVGPWTVNVSVSGGTQIEVPPPPPDADFGAVAFFEVHPGDAIVVTFENIPGYGAQPPSGIPPVLPVEDEER